MKINIKKLKEKSSERRDGYVQDVLSKGVVTGDFLEIKPAEYKKLLEKYNPSALMPITSNCCSKKLPPMTTQIKNVMSSAGKVVSAVMNGSRVMADKDEVEKRKNVCNQCEFLIKEKGRCSKCGCFYAKKIMLDTEKCPMDFW
jgi:hypothetical protein